MQSLVLGLQAVDQTSGALVGGKGANLGELTRIEGIRVPPGFCVTTEAYKRIIEQAPSIDDLLAQLALLTVADRALIATLSGQLRDAIEAVAMPQDMQDAIAGHLKPFGEQHAFAVRSSATAEDLPTASFAGQQDTYLNIIGQAAIRQHISKCWASLFTERAVLYRLQHGIDHRSVQLAVVVQQMVVPQVSGILFTADPVTSNRTITSIDASFGLGEALVGGLVNADNYSVRAGEVISRQLATKERASYAVSGGGTEQQPIAPDQQQRPALTDEQAIRLERIGRQIEAHFGCPQDIEWCLVGDTFHIVQSRPITTLYPIPDATDPENHVYISVGHQQMMTDAMKPLGWSTWQFMANAPMRVAGGRLFVDVAPMLASPAGRANILDVLGRFDPLIKDALTTILERGDFIPALPDHEPNPGTSHPASSLPDYQTLKDYDPAIVADLIQRSQAALAALKQAVETEQGPALIQCIREDVGAVKRSIPQSFGVIMTAMNAALWLNEHIAAWLGEKNVADTLTQSVPNNITSEMGLALLDVADALRPYPAVIQYVQQCGKDDTFLDELPRLAGGPEARAAIDAFLDKYGMRCPGEIDITRPRWRERPSTLVPLILNNIKNVEPNAGKRKFEQGQQEALAKEQELLARLTQLPDGDRKANETKRMIDLVRNLTGYREYPKYDIISRYFVYKQALRREAERLVAAGVLHDSEDSYYLTFDELAETIRTQTVDYALINQRKADYQRFEKLSPPRVITSEGEILTGRYRRDDLPAGAIVGLAVSAGVVEGRARVVLSLEAADLEEGDILVTPFTDPGWTPLFVTIKGLITEVGGLMTHGAVIAREYGLPAIVGVDNATKRIRDGQRIRVNGTEGYVEIL
ncbi:phosphoenolpyruvate synthase [Fibrella aestuarina BUZ 2]|uniref:Prodigiosin synthesizing transferase PigC n=2 Tax=Fibrella TaxID=861914 RepID=I0KEW4_9BACT|nr:phosphoenolpyruvate synthase [Fibrella aestuarina BUZ 2]